jgi:hypothetical protein
MEEAGFVNVGKVEKAFGMIAKTTNKNFERTKKRLFKRTVLQSSSDDQHDFVDSSDI